MGFDWEGCTRKVGGGRLLHLALGSVCARVGEKFLFL